MEREMSLRILIAALAIWGMAWSKDAEAIYMVEICTYNPTTVCDNNGCRVDAGERCRYENWEGGGGGYYDPDPIDWGGGGGGAAPVVVDATEGSEAITCSSELATRQGNASYVAANNNIPVGPRGRGRTITIRWSTGTVETYISNGAYTFGLWMEPIPGTCRDA
jgi:hypothetical protein